MKAAWQRRCTHVVRVAQTAAAGIAAFVLINFDPGVVVQFAIDGPNGVWQVDDTQACTKEPESQVSQYPGDSGLDDLRRVSGGIPILARLCFTPRVSEDGQMLIPVSEEGNAWTGWPKDSPQALKYANTMAAAFDPTADADRQASLIAERQSYQAWRTKVLGTVGMALAAIAGIEVLWQMLAWIMRSIASGTRKPSAESN